MKKIILILILSICLISFVSSEGIKSAKKDTCIELYQTCGNCTNYVNITGVQRPDLTMDIINEEMTTTNNYDYTYTYCNTSQTGFYEYNTCGDKHGTKRCEVLPFEITLRGTKITIGEAVVYGIAILILFGMMMACIFGIKKSDKLYMKFGLGYLAYLFLTIISYITWVTSTAMTETAFIDRFFYWIFIILTIGFVPLFLGTIVYYIYTVITIKPIMEMMKRGVPEDRAYADQIRKDMKRKGGWM